MRLVLSRGLTAEIPELQNQLLDVVDVVKRMDRDIRFRHLRVEANKCSYPDTYSGFAYPEERTRTPWSVVEHKDGRIKMTIGSYTDEEGIIRLFSHELRHIGQFHRGRKKHGVLTIHPLDAYESEEDAYAFEERVLERM